MLWISALMKVNISNSLLLLSKIVLGKFFRKFLKKILESSEVQTQKFISECMNPSFAIANFKNNVF